MQSKRTMLVAALFMAASPGSADVSPTIPREATKDTVPCQEFSALPARSFYEAALTIARCSASCEHSIVVDLRQPLGNYHVRTYHQYPLDQPGVVFQVNQTFVTILRVHDDSRHADCRPEK